LRKSLHKYSFLSVFFLLVSLDSFGQKTQSFRVRKPEGDLIFYQKGQVSDSLLTTKTNEFVLIVPEGMKKYLRVFLDNAQLVKTENDSVFHVNFIRGLAYECYYSSYHKKHEKDNWEFLTLVNGVVPIPSQKVKIEIVDVRNQSIILTNTFYFKVKD
jgi:hypothetical protein